MALDTCKEVLQLDPNNFKAIFRAAECHSELGNVDECIVYLEKCRKEYASEQKCKIMLPSPGNRQKNEHFQGAFSAKS